MPASKTFEMKFQLGAKADGSFSSTFSKAQQELSRMQQEIQKLNSVQGDISSYQKQQQAIEATSQKLQNLYRQQELLKRQKEEMKAAGQSTAALEREELKLAQQVQNTENKLESQNQKLTQTGDRLRSAGVDMNNLSSESQRLGNEMNHLRSEQERVADEANRMGQSMTDAMEAASAAITAAGIVQGLREIYDAFKQCVEVAAEFEATMSTVEALSGANGEEMSSLSSKAKELGATTVFSAQEAADAMTYMGMAGWKAQDMISGMDGVLNLAAASGEDLALVSDIVTDNLTAFGLKASDTARFADVLASAATNSNTSVSIMGETFKQSAAIAGALGYDIEDVAVAVGLMANAGIKGSIAGTALKNTFNGLLEGATLTGQAFGEYEFSALQADGTMKDFSATMNELRGVFGQMTEAEKVQNAMTLASKRGYNGLLAVLNATEEDYQKLTAAINESSGAAERMSKIKLDNLKGDLALANSAAEAFKENVGAALIPILRGLVQAGTQALTAMAGFAEKFPEVTQAVAALAAGLGAAVAGIVAFSAAAKIIPLVLGVISANPIVLLAGAFAGLAVAGIAGADAVKANRDEAYQMTDANRALYQEIQQTNAAYQAAIAAKGADSAEAIALRAHMDELTEAYEANKQTVSDWVQENADLISSVQESQKAYQDTVDSINDGSTEAQALAYRLEQLAGKGKLTDAELAQMNAIIGRLNTAVPELGLEYDTTTGKLTKSTEVIKQAAKAQADLQIEQEKQQRYTDLIVEQARLTEQQEEAVNNLAAAQERLNALEGSQGPGSTLQDRQAYQEAAEAVELYQSELNNLQGTLDGVNAELGGFEAKMAESAGAAQGVDEAVANVQNALSTLSTAYSEAYGAAYESLSGQFSLWEQAAEVSATSLSTLQENIQSQIDYWTNYNTNLDTVKQAASDAGIDISGIWGHLTDGSADAVNAVAGIASAISTSSADGTAALQTYVDSYSQLQDAMGQTADTIAEGSGAVQTALGQVQEALSQGATDLNFSEEFRTAAQETIQAFAEGFGEGTDIGTALEGLRESVASGISGMDFTAETTQVGADFGAGFANGIKQGEGEVNAASTAMGEGGINALKSATGSHSPSTITHQIGVDVVQGFVNGINESSDQAVTAMQNVGTQVIEAFRDMIDGLAGGVGEASGIADAFSGLAESITAQVEALDLSAETRVAGEATAAGYQEGLSSSGAGGGLEALRGEAAAAVEGLNLSAEAVAAGTATIQGYQTGLSSGAGVSLGALRGEAAAAVASLNLSAEAIAAGTATMTGYQTGLSANGGPGPAMEAAKAIAMAGVQGLNLSAEATASGTATIQGFASGVSAATGLATAAMTAAAQASINAFRSSMSPGPFQAAARAAMQGAVNGVRAGQAALVAAARAAGQAAAAAFKAAQGSIGGLATGTRSAKQGLTWVGEKGPELVFFRGGATATAVQDYTTQQTAIQAIPSGATLVGTHGPELLYMQGGEIVMNASETASILRRYRTEREALDRSTRTVSDSRALSTARSEDTFSRNRREDISLNRTAEEALRYFYGDRRERFATDSETRSDDVRRLDEYRNEIRRTASLSLSEDHVSRILATSRSETEFRHAMREQETLNRRTSEFSSLVSAGGPAVPAAPVQNTTSRILTEMVYAMGGEALKDIPAYAAGTSSAQKGAALVGENGPELVYFQGGETVMPAPETMRTLQTVAQMPEMAKPSQIPASAEITQVVTVLPQLVETMMAYRQATTRTETERIQAERMDRIIERVKSYESGDSGDQSETPVNISITFQISGNPAPETVDRLEAFAYSDEFAERVNEVVAQARRDTARRVYR